MLQSSLLKIMNPSIIPRKNEQFYHHEESNPSYVLGNVSLEPLINLVSHLSPRPLGKRVFREKQINSLL